MKAVFVEMRSGAVLGAALGLALLACDSTVDQTPAPTAAATTLSTPTAAATTLPTATATATAAAAPSCADGDSAATIVVYSDAGDLWSYDPAADRGRRLTDDADARSEHAPDFLTGACVVFESTNPGTIEVRQLAGAGASRTIVRDTAAIADLDVNSDMRSVLYLEIDYDGDAAFRLKQVGIDGGTPEVLHTFSPTLGRGAGSEDEVSVAWSPDGSRILIANTHEFSKEFEFGAIYLFDATGREILGRWAGTHPRWSPDGETIHYRDHAGVSGQDWHAMDVQTLRATRLGMRPGANGAVVSPDGRLVAYDTSYFGDLPLGTTVSGKAPDVYIYDLTTGVETLLRRGALEPLWISPTELIVTDAIEPTSESLNSWESRGTVTKISVGGLGSAIDMTSTLDSAVYLGR